MAMTLNLILDFPSVRGLVTQGKGEKTKVIHAFQYRSAGWEEFSSVLGRIAQKLPKGVSNLRVAFSDRRLVHGGLRKPDRPKGDDLIQVLQDSVREIGLFHENEDLVIGYLDSLDPSGWKCQFLGAPDAILEPLQLAGQGVGLDAMQVTSIETVLAQAVEPSDDSPYAILDVARSNARILLVKERQVLASRVVRLSLSDQGNGTIGSEVSLPLASEVYRSLEYFNELGHPQPAEIHVMGPLANSLEEGEDWGSVLGREAKLLARPPFMDMGEKGSEIDAYFSAFLLARMNPKAEGPWLIDTKRKSRFDLACFSAALTGLVALVFGASLSIRALNGEGKSRKLAMAKMQRTLNVLRVQAEQLRQAHRAPLIVVQRKRMIAKIRKENIPLSRALATLSKKKPRNLYLSKIVLKGKTLQVDGFIDSGDQLGAIRSFGRLDRILSPFSKGSSGGGKLGEPDKKTQRTPFQYEVSLGRGGE